MSAVRKEEIYRFPEPEPTPAPPQEPEPVEPQFTPIEEMFCPPHWGKYEHSEDDLRKMWVRIWKCFKSRRLCEEFILNNKAHSLEVWCSAFETVRATKDGKFEHIRYVKKIADNYLVNETPAQQAEREAKEVEAKVNAKLEQARLKAERSGVTDPEDPDVVAFRRRSTPSPIADMADSPMAQRIKNRNRG